MWKINWFKRMSLEELREKLKAEKEKLLILDINNEIHKEKQHLRDKIKSVKKKQGTIKKEFIGKRKKINISCDTTKIKKKTIDPMVFSMRLLERSFAGMRDNYDKNNKTYHKKTKGLSRRFYKI